MTGPNEWREKVISPLERMYPNRCYDCLAAIPLDDFLCDKCQKIYDDDKARRQEREGAKPMNPKGDD